MRVVGDVLDELTDFQQNIYEGAHALQLLIECHTLINIDN